MVEQTAKCLDISSWLLIPGKLAGASILVVISNFHNHERETGLRYRSLEIHCLMAGEVVVGSRLCSSSYHS